MVFLQFVRIGRDAVLLEICRRRTGDPGGLCVDESVAWRLTRTSLSSVLGNSSSRSRAGGFSHTVRLIRNNAILIVRRRDGGRRRANSVVEVCETA